MLDPESRRLLGRMTWMGAGIGLAGAAALWIVKGLPWSLGFLAGAAVSLSGLEWWKAIARGLDSSGKRPPIASTALLVLRLPVLAGVVYVIVNASGVALGAVIGGLLVSLAGILTCVLYEAVSPKH